jgi:hypothetical protein
VRDGRSTSQRTSEHGRRRLANANAKQRIPTSTAGESVPAGSSSSSSSSVQCPSVLRAPPSMAADTTLPVCLSPPVPARVIMELSQRREAEPRADGGRRCVVAAVTEARTEFTPSSSSRVTASLVWSSRDLPLLLKFSRPPPALRNPASNTTLNSASSSSPNHRQQRRRSSQLSSRFEQQRRQWRSSGSR